MAKDLNKVVLIGRLTRDPELKYIPSGAAVANFSIANNNSWSKDGNKIDQVSFFNCIAWTKLAEVIVKYCTKGQQVCVEGRLQQRTWDDKDGNKRSAVEIVADNVQFLGKAGEGGQVDKDQTPQKNSQGPPVDNSDLTSDDDIPF